MGSRFGWRKELSSQRVPHTPARLIGYASCIAVYFVCWKVSGCRSPQITPTAHFDGTEARFCFGRPRTTRGTVVVTAQCRMKKTRIEYCTVVPCILHSLSYQASCRMCFTRCWRRLLTLLFCCFKALPNAVLVVAVDTERGTLLSVHPQT